MVLLHMTPEEDWEAAIAAGEYRAGSLTTEGFIHLSTPAQVLQPANRFYHGQRGLVLLVLDSEKLTAPVRFEEVPGHGMFPHLYGPLNLNAVDTVLPFPCQEDGSFLLPEELKNAG